MEADQLSLDFAPVEIVKDVEIEHYLELQDLGAGIKQTGHVNGELIDFGVLPKKGEWKRVTTAPVWITTSDHFYTFYDVRWV